MGSSAPTTQAVACLPPQTTQTRNLLGFRVIPSLRCRSRNYVRLKDRWPTIWFRTSFSGWGLRGAGNPLRPQATATACVSATRLSRSGFAGVSKIRSRNYVRLKDRWPTIWFRTSFSGWGLRGAGNPLRPQATATACVSATRLSRSGFAGVSKIRSRNYVRLKDRWPTIWFRTSFSGWGLRGAGNPLRPLATATACVSATRLSRSGFAGVSKIRSRNYVRLKDRWQAFWSRTRFSGWGMRGAGNPLRHQTKYGKIKMKFIPGLLNTSSFWARSWPDGPFGRLKRSKCKAMNPKRAKRKKMKGQNESK